MKGPLKFHVRIGEGPAAPVVLCELGDDGIVQVPAGIGVDIELTGLIENMLREVGADEDQIERATNKLRVQYVMGGTKPNIGSHIREGVK